jgi:ATP-binding cassette, subfamily B, multidrug efflux pump
VEAIKKQIQYALRFYKMNEPKKGQDWALLRRVLSTAAPFKSLFYTSIILAVVVTPFSIAQPFIVQKMVDEHIITKQYDGLIFWAGMFILTLVINVVMKYYFILVTAKLGQSVIKDMRLKVYSHISNLGLKYFDKTPIGTSTTRTINDIESINNVFAQGVITIVADMLTLIVVILVMLYTSWRLTAIVFLTMPFMILATYIFKEKVHDSYQTVRNKVAEMNGFLQERISGMKIVQLFNAEQSQSAVFKKINYDYTSANLDSVFYYAIFFPVVELVSAIALALMIWLGARGYIHGSVSFGALIAFPLYLNLMFRPIRFMADKFNTLQMGLVASERVFKLLDDTTYIESTGHHKTDKLKGDIRFEHVDFEYIDDNPILKNVSFEVEGGTTMAIVGTTGSGKSTIISILNRFYPIKAGNITIDGINLNDYDSKSLRRRISIVLQDVFLFEGTVLENITLRDTNISKDEVIQAAKIIGAHEYIEKLPNNYDAHVTERGSNLSLGQRQLISFVRALVFDPDILILDEATSSIDTESEAVIQYAIEKLIAKRTSIIIAHRLSTIRHANQILVLSHGQVIEIGSHTALISIENGSYRAHYEKQFKDQSTSLSNT